MIEFEFMRFVLSVLQSPQIVSKLLILIGMTPPRCNVHNWVCQLLYTSFKWVNVSFNDHIHKSLSLLSRYVWYILTSTMSIYLVTKLLTLNTLYPLLINRYLVHVQQLIYWFTIGILPIFTYWCLMLLELFTMHRLS